jgi:hypothetical protein
LIIARWLLYINNEYLSQTLKKVIFENDWNDGVVLSVPKMANRFFSPHYTLLRWVRKASPCLPYPNWSAFFFIQVNLGTESTGVLSVLKLVWRKNMLWKTQRHDYASLGRLRNSTHCDKHNLLSISGVSTGRLICKT